MHHLGRERNQPVDAKVLVGSGDLESHATAGALRTPDRSWAPETHGTAGAPGTPKDTVASCGPISACLCKYWASEEEEEFESAVTETDRDLRYPAGVLHKDV